MKDSLLDTKCCVDENQYPGKCTLCGIPRHDKNHCRCKSYVDENKINLACYTYIPEEKLDQQLAFAINDGFLRGATPDEIAWVKKRIAELRQARYLLYQSKNNNFNPRRSQSPYDRSPSPYERQPLPPTYDRPQSTPSTSL